MLRKILLTLLLLIAILLFLVGENPAFAATRQYVTNSQLSNLAPSPVQLSSGKLVMSWGYGNSIQIKQSTDNGQTWVTSGVVFPSNIHPEPDMVLGAGDRLHMVAKNLTGSLFYTYSDSDGVNWSTPTAVYTAPVGGQTREPALLELVNGDLLCAFAALQSSGNWRLVVYRSINGGQTWAKITVPYVVEETKRIEDPDMVIMPNGDLLLTYEREIFEKADSTIKAWTSSNSGVDWAYQGHVSDTQTADNEPGKAIVVGDELWYFWATDEDTGGSYPSMHIKAKRSLDNGQTWQAKVLVDDSSGGVYNVNGLLKQDGMVSVFGNSGSSPQNIFFFNITDPF